MISYASQGLRKEPKGNTSRHSKTCAPPSNTKSQNAANEDGRGCRCAAQGYEQEASKNQPRPPAECSRDNAIEQLGDDSQSDGLLQSHSQLPVS